MKNKTPLSKLLNFSIINIDKPSGPTSFTISNYIKKKLGLNKTSHFGTLDPQVSGVLPIALSRACRLSDYFMHKDKIYVGIMRIHKNIEIKELKKEMDFFKGKIIQTPPIRSRVARKPREREIKKFSIIEKNNKDILFISEVQAGTYIRKLCSDLGEKIGGAHMLELRRIKASIFSEEDKNFVNLYEFDKAVESYKNGDESYLKKILIPAKDAIKKVIPFIKIDIQKEKLKKFLTGKPLTKNELIFNLKDKEFFSIFNKNQFIGIYKKTEEKDIIAKPKFIFN